MARGRLADYCAVAIVWPRCLVICFHLHAQPALDAVVKFELAELVTMVRSGNRRGNLAANLLGVYQHR